MRPGWILRRGSEVACRGIRGATTMDEGSDGGALDIAVGELLEAMTSANRVGVEDIAALMFTMQDDMAHMNPAAVARALGFATVPLLMVREHGGDTRVYRCLRALMLVNSPLPQSAVRHVYLRGAQGLRPDLAVGAGGRL